MIALQGLDRDQQAAVDHPLDGALVAIVGPPGSGKSVALLRRAERAHATLQHAEVAVLAAPAVSGVDRLRRTLDDALADRVVCGTLGEIAFAILSEYRFDTGRSADLELVDDVRAAEIFERAGSQLFALEWSEFVSAQVDPEITGMRAPERFASAAYRLIRKLRIADISPDEFLAAGMRGAASFYAHPPNLANPDLIEQTAQRYRDSLLASAAELARQRAREIDLVKILAQLYRSYLDSLVSAGCMTAIDALVEARRLFERQPDAHWATASRLRFCFVDDAQDLSLAEVRFLQSLFGDTLERVTFAGDPEQRTLGFAGPRAEGILDRAASTFRLETQHRGGSGIVSAARRILDPNARAVSPTSAITVYRADDMLREAAFVAERVSTAVAGGTPPCEIAVIARSLRCSDAYAAALLDRGIPVDPAGDGSLFDFAPVQDGLAALWALADAYRHDWLLRNLEAPWLRLSDATIATLCGEPTQQQALLFDVPGEVEDERGRRWDRHRNFRLARNVVRGDRDDELTPDARERLQAFRGARRRWAEAERRLDVASLARTIFADTVLGGTSGDARARIVAGLVERLTRAIQRFTEREPRATLLDFLVHAERVAASDDDLLAVEPLDSAAVALRDVEAAKGQEYSQVFVVDVRAGAFPQYYVPEAFLFTPKYGMIPKENVGGVSSAARTAKFTYLQYKLGLRARYNAEERRALYCALTRARDRVYVTASGYPTRGVAAPELLEELREVARSADR
jgi:superfamily I DNA/RNA helicase